MSQQPTKRSERLRIVWTLTICTSLALFGDATLYAVLPSQFTALGIAAVHVGWLLSVNRLVRVPLNLASGWLSERLGFKGPYVVGLGIGAISTISYGLSRNFWSLLAARALWGLAWTLLAVAAYGMILDVTDEENRGQLTGIYASYSYFGGSLGMLLGGLLVDWLAFSRAMIILGICSCLGLLGALTLPHLPPRQRAPSLSAGRSGSPTVARLRLALASLRRWDARVWVIVALNFAHRFFFAGMFYSTFGLYLQEMVGERAHLGPRLIGIASLTSSLLFLRNVITIVAAPGLGLVSDRLQERPHVLLVGELVGIAALVSFALGRSAWFIGVGVLLAAVAYGVVPSLLIAWLGDLTKVGTRGRFIGLHQTAGDLGSGLGPLFAYFLLSLWGIRTVYALGAGLLVFTIPLILWARSWSHDQAAQREIALNV